MPVAGSYIHILLFASCSAVCWPLLCVSRITRIICIYVSCICIGGVYRIFIHVAPPPNIHTCTHTHTRPSLYIFSFLYIGTMMVAARVKSKRGISRKHQPAREERETGYFISRPPRIEISLKSTLVLCYTLLLSNY